MDTREQPLLAFHHWKPLQLAIITATISSTRVSMPRLLWKQLL